MGFTYDKQRDTMWVLDKAVAHVAGNDTTGDMDVTAGAFGEARRDRYMRLERQARVTRPGQTFAADDMMVYLLPDRDEPDSMELRGNATISGGTGFGSLRAMKARDINLDYADDGRTVQHVTLSGQASITLAGATPAAARPATGRRVRRPRARTRRRHHEPGRARAPARCRCRPPARPRRVRSAPTSSPATAWPAPA